VKISTAAISKSRSRTRGVAPGNRDRPSSVATQIAAAPSVRGELLPAVSVPRPLVRSNAARSLASFSSDVSRRGKWSLVGPPGKVIGYEVEADLAIRARDNLAPLRNVEVRSASGVVGGLPRADAIYVNAGATRPVAAWLDALNDNGRLVFPLSGRVRSGAGVSLLIERVKDVFSARVIGFCIFIPCEGAFDAEEASDVTAAFQAGTLWMIQSLVRNDQPDDTAVLVGDGWWLSSRPAAEPG
jgi:hypothetical protein